MTSQTRAYLQITEELLENPLEEQLMEDEEKLQEPEREDEGMDVEEEELNLNEE